MGCPVRAKEWSVLEVFGAEFLVVFEVKAQLTRQAYSDTVPASPSLPLNP